MSREDFLWPGDTEMIAAAISDARRAGVPEKEIEAVVAEETAPGLRDELTTPIISGRLGYLASDRRRRLG